MGTPGREPTVSDDEIIDVFFETTDPVLSTREVADAIGLGRRGTLDRLQQLAANGHLERKNLGNKHTIWWHSDALEQRYSPAE